jgi:hypothetical protein
MIRRPRCRSCNGRIWPWQDFVGWGEMGARDNDRERWYARHQSCAATDIEARRAQRAARVQQLIDDVEQYE